MSSLEDLREGAIILGSIFIVLVILVVASVFGLSFVYGHFIASKENQFCSDNPSKCLEQTDFVNGRIVIRLVPKGNTYGGR